MQQKFPDGFKPERLSWMSAGRLTNGCLTCITLFICILSYLSSQSHVVNFSTCEKRSWASVQLPDNLGAADSLGQEHHTEGHLHPPGCQEAV